MLVRAIGYLLQAAQLVGELSGAYSDAVDELRARLCDGDPRGELKWTSGPGEEELTRPALFGVHGVGA